MKYLIKMYTDDPDAIGGVKLTELVIEDLDHVKAWFQNIKHRAYLFEYDPQTKETGKLIDAKD